MAAPLKSMVFQPQLAVHALLPGMRFGRVGGVMLGRLGKVGGLMLKELPFILLACGQECENGE